MRRREFITLVGGAAAAWPVRARAQQAMPVVGFARNTSPNSSMDLVAAFRNGLQETGYVEGQNVRLEFRWGENNEAKLDSMLGDLIDDHVAVIVAGGNDVALAAKKTGKTIPVVFAIGLDPVKLGLVDSMNRPGGN